jgi:hypothetical protein
MAAGNGGCFIIQKIAYKLMHFFEALVELKILVGFAKINALGTVSAAVKECAVFR